MHKLVIILSLFLFIQKISVAQDTLPNISVSELSKKVLISWTNPFVTVTSINIQRSYDSLKNFTTIGSVLNVSAATNGYVDSKVFIPAQYYRLFISFEGGTYLFTKSHRPSIDTTKTESGAEFQQAPVQTWFTPSKLVYTGRENNVIISLPAAEKKKYSIKFFEKDGTLLFEIKKITDSYLILDKVNFIHAGLFDFEVYDNNVLVERHKIYIPRDGKPMPALDVNGRELN